MAFLYTFLVFPTQIQGPMYQSLPKSQVSQSETM